MVWPWLGLARAVCAESRLFGVRRLNTMVPVVLCVAGLSTLACKRTTSVGSFVVDVPPGWRAERDGDALGIAARDHEWTWVMSTFEAELANEAALADAGREVASDWASDEDEGDEVNFSFGEPRAWSGLGVTGIVMDGELGEGDFRLRMMMVVVSAGDGRYMVALGIQGPHARPKDDARMRAMLESIRIESPF